MRGGSNPPYAIVSDAEVFVELEEALFAEGAAPEAGVMVGAEEGVGGIACEGVFGFAGQGAEEVHGDFLRDHDGPPGEEGIDEDGGGALGADEAGAAAGFADEEGLAAAVDPLFGGIVR